MKTGSCLRGAVACEISNPLRNVIACQRCGLHSRLARRPLEGHIFCASAGNYSEIAGGADREATWAPRPAAP